jgi:xanthine dehydrogenase small subunit
MRKRLKMRKEVIFYLNGHRHAVGAKEASMMLAEYLRYEKGLTGTKIVCAEGDCGACSVLRYFPHVPGKDSRNYVAINSCITLVAQLDGSSLVTVDALKEKEKLHEAQRAMVECHGSQCGFCTPGFVMALTGLVEEKIERSEKSIKDCEAKNALTGNLCRCTGYAPIISAALSIDLEKCESIKKRFYSEKQDSDLKNIFREEVELRNDDFSFYAPKTLKAALDYLQAHSDVKILASGTDLGVVHNKRKITLNKLMSLHLISELYDIKMDGDVVILGARVTHTEFRHFIKDKMPEFSSYLDIFASPQIKNMGTVIGNVANASPIGDTPPALLALNATVVVQGPQGKKEIPLSQFFLAYRKTALTHLELITHIKFALPHANSKVKFYKYSNRKDLDISAVNFAVNLTYQDDAKKAIKDIIIAAGGVGPVPMRFLKTEEYLKKHKDLEGAVKVLHTEFTPLSDVRASRAYRHVLIENYLRKFMQGVTL